MKDPWPRRRSRRSSRSRSRPGRPPRPRPSAPRSARTAWPSWTSARQYNAATEAQRGTIVPVEITVFEDRSFTFILKTPPTPVLLRAGGRPREGLRPRRARGSVGSVTEAQVAEIAQIKMPDLNANDLEAAKQQVAGTARSHGPQGRLTTAPAADRYHRIRRLDRDHLARPA